jgi:hypothetical protein
MNEREQELYHKLITEGERCREDAERARMTDSAVGVREWLEAAGAAFAAARELVKAESKRARLGSREARPRALPRIWVSSTRISVLSVESVSRDERVWSPRPDLTLRVQPQGSNAPHVG